MTSFFSLDPQNYITFSQQTRNRYYWYDPIDVEEVKPTTAYFSNMLYRIYVRNLILFGEYTGEYNIFLVPNAETSGLLATKAVFEYQLNEKSPDRIQRALEGVFPLKCRLVFALQQLNQGERGELWNKACKVVEACGDILRDPDIDNLCKEKYRTELTRWVTVPLMAFQHPFVVKLTLALLKNNTLKIFPSANCLMSLKSHFAVLANVPSGLLVRIFLKDEYPEANFLPLKIALAVQIVASSDRRLALFKNEAKKIIKGFQPTDKTFISGLELLLESTTEKEKERLLKSLGDPLLLSKDS